MKTKAAKKADDEDEAKPKKIRSSRGKRRRRGRHSRSRSRSPSDSGSGSDSPPPRKRSKKPTKKIVDKKSKKNKGSSTSRRRHRSLSPSPSRSLSSSPSSVTRSHSRRSRHSSSAPERSVSPPPRSRSRDARKRKGRGRNREKDRKRRRTRRSRSYSSSPASSGSSRSKSKSKSRKRRSCGTRDDASRDRIVQDYDNCHDSRTEKNSVEDVDRDEEAVAVATKGMSDVDDYEKNVGLEKMESPPSKGSNETGEISSPKDANERDEILPAGSPEAEEDLELILRQRALENFRKFRGAVVVAGKTDSNGAGNEVLTDSPQNTVTKNSEARSAVTPFQREGSSFGVSHSAGSPELGDIGNGTSPWKQETSRGDRSPGMLKPGYTIAPTHQQGSRLEAIRSTSQITSQGGRNGGSVMQRLGSTPGSSASVKQRLGSSAGVRPASATPRVRSVVSIPTREGLDGGTFTTTPTACEDPAPIESSSEVRHSSVEIDKFEGTNGDDRMTGEASAPDSSVLSTDEGKRQAGTEGKDGSQFEKRTFSRMHDGETVQVSYKVYIPTKSPRLARRKLQS